MFRYTHTKIVAGLSVTICKISAYPLPWVGEKRTRPENYYAQIETHISFQENDQNIKIIIPKALENINRTKVIQVFINDEAASFNEDFLAILDMTQTFDVPDAYKLLKDVINEPISSDGKTHYACLPYFYSYDASYKVPARKIEFAKSHEGNLRKTNGNISALIAPYIKTMANCPGKKREIYIPVVTSGDPHHWFLFFLTINERNQPSLTFVESANSHFKDQIKTLYLKEILPALNWELRKNNFPQIKVGQLNLDISKQFSERGCGIATASNIHNIFNGSLKTKPERDSALPYPRVSIEEDAIRRVQLACQISKHQRYRNQINQERPASEKITPVSHYQFEEVLQDMRTHPFFLKQHAEECFPALSAPVQGSPVQGSPVQGSPKQNMRTPANLIAQIAQIILNKKNWHFSGLIGYSHYYSDDLKTSIPKGIKVILSVIDDQNLSDDQKLDKIKKIAEDRKSFRGASLVPGFGLFMRSDDTKQTYTKIFELCVSSVQEPSPANFHP